MLFLITASRSAAAACGNWNGNFALAPGAARPSEALDASWSAVVQTCIGGGDYFVFYKYMVCRNEGAVPPGTPGSADSCITETTRTTTARTDWVHRSAKQFAETLFACDDAGCTHWYGDSSGTRGTHSNFTDSELTVNELWVLTDIADYDATERAVHDEHAVAASAMMYPSGWGDAGYLGLWWSTYDDDSAAAVFHAISADSGWSPSGAGNGWNTVLGFDQTTGDPTTGLEVARGIAVGSGDLLQVTHPWVMPAEDGDGNYIRMFFQGSNSDYEDWYVDSVDENGADFKLACVSGTCTHDGDTCDVGDLCDWDDMYGDDASDRAGVATKALCSDETAACDYMDTVMHGGALWDAIEHSGGADFGSDTPGMLVSGEARSPCASYLGDVFQATWASGSWSIPNDTSFPYCAVEAVAERHDPSAIGLPGSEFKAYMKEGTDQFQVCYSEDGGATWGDCADIWLAFDGGTSNVSHLQECVGNMAALNWFDGSGYEGAFLHAARESAPSAADCFTEGDGIVFIDHVN